MVITCHWNNLWRERLEDWVRWHPYSPRGHYDSAYLFGPKLLAYFWELMATCTMLPAPCYMHHACSSSPPRTLLMSPHQAPRSASPATTYCYLYYRLDPKQQHQAASLFPARSPQSREKCRIIPLHSVCGLVFRVLLQTVQRRGSRRSSEC